MPGRKKARFDAATRKREASPPSDSEISSNRYDILNSIGDQELVASHSEPSAVMKKAKVPPIVVIVSNFKAFRSELSSFLSNVKVNFQICRRGEIRILAETFDGHKHLLQYLTEKMYKFYSFDAKSERPFKAVLKGLSNDQTVGEISDCLTELLGFAPNQVILMKRKANAKINETGIHQENYLVHFDRTKVNNLKYLEKARVLFNVRIKWENFKRLGGIHNLTQCRNCQAYGHGTRNCHMAPKCMICGDSSHTKDNCPVKEAANSFKCVNCGGKHKSNFFDCPVRSKIIASRQRRYTKQPVVNVNPVGNQKTFNAAQTSPAFPLASVSVGNILNSDSNKLKTINSVQAPAGCSYASALLGNTNSNCNKPFVLGAEKSASCDLGSPTLEKMDYLQQSMLQLMSALLNCNSMYEAVQVGMKFTTEIVMKLKFSNDFK